MELEVLRTKGIPETGVISIRAGNTRRQAHVNGWDRPMAFPQSEDCTGFKIDVLDLLGTARVTLDKSSRLSYEYAVDVEPSSDEKASDMQVTFVIRNGAEGGAEPYSSEREPHGSKETVNFEKLDLNQDGVVTRDEFDKAMNKADWVRKRESAAQGYLQEHGLVPFMQYLMQSLMKDKPSDPYGWLQKQVAMRAAQQRLAASGEEASVTALIERLDPKSPTVSVDKLAELEREANEAGEKLRQDNNKLRHTALDLRAEYEKLLEESIQYRDSIGPDHPEFVKMDLPPVHRPTVAKVGRVPGETAQLHAYREIALVQDEVCSLAKENAALVEELARMRAAVDSVRNEIGDLSTTVDNQPGRDH